MSDIYKLINPETGEEQLLVSKEYVDLRIRALKDAFSSHIKNIDNAHSDINDDTVKSAALLDNMIENLVDNGKYIVMNDEETMQTARSQFISSQKIRYSYMVSIYDYTNNMLGFVLAEYDHVYTKNESDKEYAALRELADKIAPILSFSEYSKLTLSTLNQ